MKVVIDTSSLIALVRYYLPFDTGDSLKNFIKGKIEDGEIIILDKVGDELKYHAKGIVLEAFEFLGEKSIYIKTIDLLPSSKFFNMLENQFCIQSEKKKLLEKSEVLFESKKQTYLNEADAKLILYCQKIRDSGDLGFDEVEVILVTEETPNENDGKPFKKLPAICKILEIDCCNLPTLLKEHFGLKLSEYLE